MLKKHLIPLTVILGLLLMAKVFAYKLPTKVENLKKDYYTKTVNETDEPVFTIAQLEFANENLPEGDDQVAHKMKRTLASFSYQNLRTDRLHLKAAKWFPVVEPILAKYGIPDDFKYLALVESGLKGGVSPKGAAGYWQFMPATARIYGLKVNSKVDERYDLRKSTIAAAKYIRYLHGKFGNWALAAAAYNVGDGHMRRQMKSQKKDNYFKLRLNRETGAYVYKLISVKEILENPLRNGYKDQKAFVAYKKEEVANGAQVE